MEKTEYYFEQIIKFRGYTLQIYGNRTLSVTLTKDTCQILSFHFSTNLANPNHHANKPWKSSKLICSDKRGNLCLDLCSKRIEKKILRIPWNIINPIMDGVTERFTIVPEGLIKYFKISAVGEDDKDFICTYEVVFPEGSRIQSGGSWGGKNKISLWMQYCHPGEKHSLNDEKVLIDETISFCNKAVSSIIEDCNKKIAKIEARNNYVRSDNDEKVYLFSDNNYCVAITENGVKICSGIIFCVDVSSINFYDHNISEMEKSIAEDYWQLLPVVATSNNEEAMKVLDSFIEGATDNSLCVLISLRNYMNRSKVCV